MSDFMYCKHRWDGPCGICDSRTVVGVSSNVSPHDEKKALVRQVFCALLSRGTAANVEAVYKEAVTTVERLVELENGRLR